MTQDRSRRWHPRRQAHSFVIYAKNIAVTVALIMIMALLTSCGSGSGSGTQQGTGGSTSGNLQVTLSTTLYPTFDPNISDYVSIPTPGSSTQVSVSAPANTQVSVDGQPFRASSFTTPVRVSAGQSFSFVVNAAGTSKTYYVRSLPADFPSWSAERPGTPQAEFFIFAPNISVLLGTGGLRNYVVIADSYGVPLWWYRSTTAPLDATLLANGNIAWLSAGVGEERHFDGSLVHKFVADSLIGGSLDTHELKLLPNGNYLYIAYVPRGPVDLSAYGGLPSHTLLDAVIEEVTPAGSLVWHWSALDHISVAETDPLWRPQYITQLFPADPYHMNSIELDGNGYVISFRHLNAVYRIDKASGNIVWKLGGSPRPESLAFRGDTYGNFGGQHDARILTDGTMTLHDNGTQLGRLPRAVRYRIDTGARTATLVEQVIDPDAASSICCGSARKLPGGDWVAAWGQNPYVTELAPGGKRVFRMTLQNPPYYSYRAEPVLPGVLNRATLRQGMDAQFPR